MLPTPYEKKALKEIRDWRAREPGWGAQLLARPGARIAQAVEVVLPVTALRKTLEGADRLARRLSDRGSILRKAGVGSLAELRTAPLEDCDRLSRSMIRRGALMAGASGAVFGVAGAAGLVADVPSLLVLALRTIHRVGLCYGEDPSAEEGRELGIGIFAVVSANSMEEKQAALAALDAGREQLQAAWRDGVERVAERELAKEAVVLSMQTLAQRIGLNLGKRKAAGSIPVVGAAIGGAVNASYLSDVGEAARHVFRERWLRDRHRKDA